MTTAASILFTSGYGSPVESLVSFLVGSFLMLNMDNVAYAADTSCTPTMEIVLEAPPYYLGSVAECKAEVENTGHCPEDFPVFPTCSSYSPSCEVAVVGAGTGGLYTALRLVDENKVNAADVCIFEATERVGGRLYSLRGFGPNNKITVDAGGYRTWPEYTVSFVQSWLHRYRACSNPMPYFNNIIAHNSCINQRLSWFERWLLRRREQNRWTL